MEKSHDRSTEDTEKLLVDLGLRKMPLVRKIKIKLDEIDRLFNNEILCPYCGYFFNSEDSCDPFAGKYYDGATTKVDCGECEKTFEVALNLLPRFSSFII